VLLFAKGMKTLKITIRFIGFVLIGIFILQVLSVLVAVHENNDDSLYPLLISAGIILAFGLSGILTTKPARHISIKAGYFIITGCWLASCFFGALPFMLYGHEFSVVNACFESVSGFTTTGASILNDIEAVPKGLLFWRIATSWIGGIGVVSLVSIVISANDDHRSIMAGMELSTIAKEYYQGRRKQFIYRILTVYVFLTLASFFALHFAGMNWFDAAIHAMSACSTCGFSSKNNSVAFFDSPLIEGILIISMMLAAINFSLLFSTFWPSGSNRKNIFNTKLVRFFLGAVALGTVILSLDLLISGTYNNVGEAFRVSAFQLCSISTTTGFATTDTNLWPPLCKGIIFIGSLVCGCSGSTSGGIKIDRVWQALKGCSEMFQSLISPSKYDYVRVGGHAKSEEEITSVMSFILFYLLITGIGTVVYTLFGMDFETGFSASVACIGNVGPGFGEVGSMGNYAGLSSFLKWFSMILMLLGRLEIYPILIVVGTIIKRRR
jgi:trk system potassium uptake protein TrkH